MEDNIFTNNMDKILIFAGTTEGRMLCEYLCNNEIYATASVATEYGETVLPRSKFLSVLVERIDKLEMVALIQSSNYTLIIDATHPYAVEVTENIKGACEASGVKCLRLLRENMDPQNVIYVSSVEEAVERLSSTKGKALITTGSKELKVFTKVSDYASRFIVRVLPTWEVVKACSELGFQGKNLICMQGPFTEEMNYVMLKETGAVYLVTKEAGAFGGFMEKINAAKKARAVAIVIRRPQEEKGYSINEVKELLSISKDRVG